MSKVEPPQEGTSTSHYDWHVWRMLKTGKEEWMGFFRDSQTALDWVKAQGGRDLKINNVPPSAVPEKRDKTGRFGFPWSKDYVRQADREKDSLFEASKKSPARKKTVRKKADDVAVTALKDEAKESYAQRHAEEAAEESAKKEEHS